MREFTVKQSPGGKGVKTRKTNILVEALNRGLNEVSEYIWGEGLSNIRAALKKNNQLEIENEVSQFNVSFFHKLVEKGSLSGFKTAYQKFMDMMQLSNFMEIFTFWSKQSRSQSTVAIFDFILTDPKFHSLFSTSLEFQKYILIKELCTLDSQYQLGFTKHLLHPTYLAYLREIQLGNSGD